MGTQIKSLIIRNTIARYEPFTIKEVFHTRLNRVVHYAVFIDNDPLKLELGFDKILFNNSPFEPRFGVGDEKDNYFLTKLTEIIIEKLKSQHGGLYNAQNMLKDVLANPVEDPIEQELNIESIKEYILKRTQRIEFIKAAEENLKTKYKFI
jgi:RNAse (barnase) inhibitor barstar